MAFRSSYRLVALLTMTLLPAAGAGAADYLVVSKTNALPSGLATKVKAAGGTITRTVGQVGIAVGSLGRPGLQVESGRHPRHRRRCFPISSSTGSRTRRWCPGRSSATRPTAATTTSTSTCSGVTTPSTRPRPGTPASGEPVPPSPCSTPASTSITRISLPTFSRRSVSCPARARITLFRTPSATAPTWPGRSLPPTTRSARSVSLPWPSCCWSRCWRTREAGPSTRSSPASSTLPTTEPMSST